MIYYKKIDLPGWQPAAKFIHEYVKTRTGYLQRGAFWNNLLMDKHRPCYDVLTPLFKSAGFDLLRASFLILNTPSAEIHTDNNYLPDYPDRLARINIPIFNCEHSETQFFSSTKWDPIVKTLNNGIEYTYHSPVNCKLEASTSITEPTVIRVRELHNVLVHKEAYPRLAITCALDPDPVYLLEEN